MIVKFLKHRPVLFLLIFYGVSFPFLTFPALAEKSPDKILAGVHRNFPPHYSLDEKTGRPTGFAIDIMDEVAKRAGLKVRYIVFDEWAPLIQALKKGDIDLIPNIGIIEEREKDVDYTSPVETYDIRIFVRKTTTDIRNIDDLRGRKVAVVSENKGLFLIQEYGKAKPVISKSLDEALVALLSGNADALIYPEQPVLFIARKSNLLDRIKTVGDPLFEVKRAIAVGEGNTKLLTKLDLAVNAVLVSPEYKKIYAKWYAVPEPHWQTRQVVTAIGLCVAFLIIIFAVWHYLALMRLNRNLENSIKKEQNAKEELRESEERYRSLVETQTDLVSRFTPDGRLSFVNDAFCRFFEKSNEELMGKNWHPLKVDEDVASIEKKMLTLSPSNPSVFIENRVISGKGDVHWIQFINSGFFDPQGNLVEIQSVGRDITERKQVEENLRQSETRFRDLAELMPEIVFEIDLNGILTFTNKNAFERFGYTQEDFEGGLNVLDMVNSDDHGRVLENMQKILNGEDIGSNEYLMRRKDGSVFPALIYSTSIIRDGRSVGLRGFLVDITERKQAEEVIKKNLWFQQMLMNAISFPIYHKDTEGIYRGGNKALEQLWGRSLDQIVGRTVYDIAPSDLADIYERADKELLNNPGVQTYESSVASSSGIRRNVIFNKATFTDAEGKVAGLIGVIVDITDRKQAETALQQSEDKFRLAFQTSPDSITINRLEDGLFVDINQGFIDLTGFTREDVIGRTALDLNIYPNLADRERLVQGLRERGYFENLETQFRRKDGSLFTGLVSAKVLKLGEVFHSIVITRDITERRQAEEEKRKLEEQLQRAEKMEALGTLAGGVAHDLNNVLGVIVGFSELLLYDVEESSPLRPGLVNILSGSQRAAAIVQDLLGLARRGVIVRQVLNLNKIIVDGQNSLEFKNLYSYHSSVKIKNDLEPDLLNISGSAIHLGKALFNLVSNASEAMPNGGTLTINTSNEYLDRPIQGYDEVREGDYVVLSVSDTGEGIPADDLKRIFEPFYTKKVMGRSGTGLGLAVVWGTVKDHHGYINVQSEEGKGSTFTLYFPVTREGITTQDDTIPLSEYLGKGETIMVVDDVKGQRDLATTMLRKLNYTVTSVSSGEEALSYLKEHTVDLLVLDMIMDPGMDGLETYQKILETHPRQKAIVVSGFSESDRVHSTQALGAGDYIRKPYVIEKLGLAVRKELDRAMRTGEDQRTTIT
jgi:PAS domain S-box-containing protein